MPEALGPLWDAFCHLSGGDEPVRLTELAAWQQVHGVALSPWEVDTLLDMDRKARETVQRLRPH